MAKNLQFDTDLDGNVVTITGLVDGADYGDMAALVNLVHNATKAGFTVSGADSVLSPLGPWSSGTEAQRLVMSEIYGSMPEIP